MQIKQEGPPKVYVVTEGDVLEFIGPTCEVDLDHGDFFLERGHLRVNSLEGVSINLSGPHTASSPGCETQSIEPDNFHLSILGPNPSLLRRIRFRLSQWVSP